MNCWVVFHCVVQFSRSVMSYSLRLMDCNTPSFPVHYQLLKLAQIHVHWVGDAIQPSHPCCPLLLSIFPSIRVFSNESAVPIRWLKYWSTPYSASASASVLRMSIQDWFPCGLTSLISLQSKGLSGVFSNTTVQKHQFFGIQLSL